MNELWNHFHFLRPLWLWALPVVVFVWWLRVRANDPKQAVKGEIASHLLEHLVKSPTVTSSIRPITLLLPLWIVAVVSLAGPAFRRQPSPFAEDKAQLMILAKMTPSMLTEDLQPSRLERVRTKLHDLLDLRKGSGSGLIAYAGSAHLVMPVTTDAGVIDHMLEALDPSIMPSEGDNLVQALDAAVKQLSEQNAAGSILVVTDAIDAGQLSALQRWRAENAMSVQILAALRNDASLAASGIPKAADTLHARVQIVSPDDHDIESIAKSADRSIVTASNADAAQWRDDGYFLVPVLAIGALFWSRRGWSVSVR
ncbi:VWA domain-containing protein [Novipirellula artificiosorum]|uniref:VWFA domain-containing protein n=1 Tax=Novipirellula artificiosorum TaxID=2528016 RepID=A0A5C6DZ01_9BACT|nr:VWA domain-containing protein [Novipirellula artificiosorum]TWU42673.1 hypothetical protein Poly41_09720 [Novipirellula artificiosorum]